MARHLLLLLTLLAVATASSTPHAGTATVAPAFHVRSATTAMPPTSSFDVFRGSRRLGPSHHLCLSEFPSDRQAPATTCSDADAPTPAPTSYAVADRDQNMYIHALTDIAFCLFVTILILATSVAGSVLLTLLFAILRKAAALLASFVADLYAAARTARPLDQDGGIEAAGP